MTGPKLRKDVKFCQDWLYQNIKVYFEFDIQMKEYFKQKILDINPFI